MRSTRKKPPKPLELPSVEQKYLDEREYLQAGRRPPATTDGCGLAQMMNHFLGNAKARVENGDLSPLSFRDYKHVGVRILEHFGRNADPTPLHPMEFLSFRNKLSAEYAPSRLTKTVTVTKMMFNWACEVDLIERPPKFGKEFKGASRKAIRKRKNQNSKSFERGELKALIDNADPALEAMILMGINCGFGNNDVSLLPKSAIKNGWVVFTKARSKRFARATLIDVALKLLEQIVRIGHFMQSAFAVKAVDCKDISAMWTPRSTVFC